MQSKLSFLIIHHCHIAGVTFFPFNMLFLSLADPSEFIACLKDLGSCNVVGLKSGWSTVLPLPSLRSSYKNDM